MGYRRAEEILPREVIELIQQYADGENIYIPRKEKQRHGWGQKTAIREEIESRNADIFKGYQDGMSVQELSASYFLSVKSIQRIIRQLKMEEHPWPPDTKGDKGQDVQ